MVKLPLFACKARDNWEVRFVTCPIARMPYNLRIERLVRTPFIRAHTHLQVILFLQRYAFLLKETRIYWKMFEGEGDKNKKGVSSLARCMGQEGYTFLYYGLG